MKKSLSAIALLLLPPAAAGQDMPLSDILPPDTTWAVSKTPAFKTVRVRLGDGESAYVDAAGPGRYYATVRGQRAVYLYDRDGGTRRFEVPLKEPTGLVLWGNGGTLVVADAGDKHLWAFRVAEDGSLTDGEPFYPVYVPTGEGPSDVGPLTTDPAGRVYAATPLGIQVFDTQGRFSGLIRKPADGEITAMFPQPNPDAGAPVLSVMCGDKRYDRPLLASGMRAPGPK